ncbi:MAG: class I SAM-dependent methyltransferase [Armatimonas sp.]
MSAEQWDAEASGFDNEPDHGLRDPVVRSAWQEVLRGLLWPLTSARVLDIGCGTGSLSVLAAELGHEVTGVDFSPEMLRIGREKAASQDLPIRFLEGDAENLPISDGTFDVILCRHVLWAVSDPKATLEHWCQYLTPNGRMVLIEGFWFTGAGIPATTLLSQIPEAFSHRELYDLSPHSTLWGKTVTDERYAILAKR